MNDYWDWVAEGRELGSELIVETRLPEWSADDISSLNEFCETYFLFVFCGFWFWLAELPVSFYAPPD